jgi:hypothetical protein
LYGCEAKTIIGGIIMIENYEINIIKEEMKNIQEVIDDIEQALSDLRDSGDEHTEIFQSIYDAGTLWNTRMSENIAELKILEE